MASLVPAVHASRPSATLEATTMQHVVIKETEFVTGKWVQPQRQPNDSLYVMHIRTSTHGFSIGRSIDGST